MFEKLRRKTQEMAEAVESEPVATETAEDNNPEGRFRVEITVAYDTSTSYHRVYNQSWAAEWKIYDTQSKSNSSIRSGTAYAKTEDAALVQAKNVAKDKVEELRLLAKTPTKKTFYL